ncbi:NAD(P)H-binding protein [Aeromicrobium sp. 636]|uniref:NAD(P)H-binding protein n=1 Tax=Aeromicrobium senzhongii TaxID=2663859 RepID=A0A8I0EWB4_9ACTN|nr:MULTISPECIES: NAD(P)H-binding protein [Aeromicrobium]MBC9226512.1 NAD(P)H-binding protein [Aeromicrobium senzhongii]MCQ3998616.1 NAD(P)H-binding protein [Aeromicrobium sp. 636]
MKVFIIGVTGAVGGLVAERLVARGVTVAGLVRREEQRERLASRSVDTQVGDLADLSEDQLATMLAESDVVVYTAGSNAGATEVTDAIDGAGVVKALAAAGAVDARFVLVSVLPESWRERDLDAEVEHYFAVKKETDVAVSRASSDWVIIRPSLLLDEPGRGTVSLGPAELHDEIPREDVADTLVEVILEPRINRQILELNTGPTPIPEAVRGNVHELS